MRKKVLAGNWKMNKNLHESILLADDIRKAVDLLANTATKLPTVILAPAFPFLYPLCQTLGQHPAVGIAAQNCHFERSGAYTGEVSVEMIRSTGARYVIAGHSERRSLFGEGDELILKKIKAILELKLVPVFCIGERAEERKTGKQFEVVGAQLDHILEGIEPGQIPGLIFAYEPVWAIGTGLNATAAQAQEMHAFIRKRAGEYVGDAAANELSVLYGGSCNPSNAAELFGCPDVDGGLIGGASLKAADFVALIKALMQ